MCYGSVKLRPINEIKKVGCVLQWKCKYFNVAEYFLLLESSDGND